MERCRCFKVSPRRVNTGHISMEKRVAFSWVFFSVSPSLSLALSLSRSLCRPAVNFLSRPVSDPEHSLPHSNLRHHPRRLRPPVPPLDGPVPHRAAMMGHRGLATVRGGVSEGGRVGMIGIYLTCGPYDMDFVVCIDRPDGANQRSRCIIRFNVHTFDSLHYYFFNVYVGTYTWTAKLCKGI